jgi:3-oxoacyl-[acyl-carrier-protein] synthase II
MTGSSLTKPIAVTGIGILTSLGEGKAENWRRLSAGESGIHRLTRFPIDGLRTTIGGSVDYLPIDPLDNSNFSFEMARRAAQEAIEESGVGSPGRFPGEMFLAAPPIDLEWSRRMGLADRREGAKTYTEMLEIAREGAEEIHRSTINGGIAARMMAEFGPEGSPITLSTACASGASAIQLGVEAIRRGSCDTALCIGTDGSIQPEALIRFSLLSALSMANEEPTKAAKPFSKNRDGFVMAEGAAALVLEDPDKAKARGTRILGYILGCGEAADTFHRTRSNPNGAAIVRCMREALADAGLGIDDVDYINAHGTGTPENDKMESFGIQQLFGERAGKIPISSNKSMIGHTLTAAGAVEAAFSILTMRNELLPPTINHQLPDPTIPLDVVPNQARPAKPRTVLSNSFGFGGQNVSLLLGAA